MAQPHGEIPFILHGLAGGTAGALAICLVQPADLVKTRMQLLGQEGQKWTAFQMSRHIIKHEGVKGLYKGLSCAIFRQYTYGLTRFAIFYSLYESYKRANGNQQPHIMSKIGMGLVAGVGGAVIGNPAEVTLIRMTADGKLPPDKRRNYSHVFNALYRITKEEGLFALWRGVESTMTRAMVITAAELGSYAQAREAFLHYMDEGILLHFAASMVAGFFATTASLPVDIVKTRVQNSHGKLGQLGVLKSILKNEGVLALWSGFLPTYAKLGPHAVITFVMFEQLHILYWKIEDEIDKRKKFEGS